MSVEVFIIDPVTSQQTKTQTVTTTKTSATFVLANNLTEQTLVEITNATGAIQSLNFYADINAITRPNFRIKLYLKIDGTNYRLHNTYTFASTDEVAQFDESLTSFDIKITALSASFEGTTRNIPYYYYLEPK